MAKPLSEREKRRQEDRLRKELETPYRRWLDEDVGYIITDEERAAFKRLSTDEERENFIEQFWLRRDPTPDTAENEFKEEHYRRIAYANERYASGIPAGRPTAAGSTSPSARPTRSNPILRAARISGPSKRAAASTSTYPFEKWRYRWMEGVGTDIQIEFVDPTMTGEYRMTMDPSEKDALLYVPNAGLTMMEQMGLANKADRFTRTDGTRLGVGNEPTSVADATVREAAAVRQSAEAAGHQVQGSGGGCQLEDHLQRPAHAGAGGLHADDELLRLHQHHACSSTARICSSRPRTGCSGPLSIIYARITSMARRVVNTFEDVVSVDVPAELLQEAVKGSSIYGKAVPLAPGMYRLNVVAKDVVGGNMNNYEVALHVPRFDDETLASSTLILADVLEPVPTRSIGAGQFVIGTSKVRPRVSEAFARAEKMGVYCQFYNFAPDQKTQKPNGTIEYEVTKDGTNEKVIEFAEDVLAIDGASANQVTVEKLLPLQSLAPGRYTLKMTALDRSRDQKVATSASFTVF